MIPKPLNRRLLGLAVVFIGFAATNVSADVASTQDSQLHFRLGMINGSYNYPSASGGASATTSAPINGSFSVSNSIDAEYEHFLSSKSSFILRTSFSYDLTNSRMDYAYTGVGKRWYFGSTGMQFSETDGTDVVSTAVKRRYYFTAEGGLSEDIAKAEGNVLVVQTSDIELGANVGVIQQMSRGWGLEAQAGYSLGFGFSTVAVGGSVLRVLLGVAVFF